MSGHSKWATIKHKKAKEDAKRGKVFTQLIREIMVVARAGGGDPANNARLRTLLEKAKAVNMPSDNVTRAIKKATGELEGAHYEEVTYEGYGPAGTAVIVETLTDNRKRTVSDLRHLFSKHGGNLGEGGSVAWMFEHKGVIRLKTNKSEDELLEKLLDYEVDTIHYDGDGLFTITCSISDLEFVKQALETSGIPVEDAKIEWVSKNPIELNDEEQEKKVLTLLEVIEDLDDVREVYTNLG